MLKPWEIMLRLNQMNISVQLSGYRQCEPDWYRPLYEHRFYSFWLITRGKGTYILDGITHTAEPGKLFIVTPGMRIERSTDPHDPLEFYFIRFSCAESFEENGEWTFGASDPDSFPLRGVFTLLDPLPIVNAFAQMDQLMKRRGQVVLMRRRILFLDILVLIVTDLRGHAVTGSTTQAIERTIDYMVNHYREKMSLEDLAALAGLSGSHYTRLFKKYTNYSPIQYLTHLRMDRAKELLILSDYKLKSIASSVGYDDELYFSRLFKKVVGLPPSVFARKHKTAPSD